MRLVLDASVAVAAARPGEPMHRAARACVERALAGSNEIVVPSLFAIEVASALARAGAALPGVRAYVDELLADARVVPLGARAARRARDLAIRWRLRAADAVYVSVATREEVPLCTLDRELGRRAAAACQIILP